MTSNNGIANDLLEQAQERVDDALGQKNLSKSDRAVLETQNSILMFLREDHKKVGEMYPYYQAQTRKEAEVKKLLGIASGTAITAIVMLIINGIIFLFISTPLLRAMIEAAQP